MRTALICGGSDPGGRGPREDKTSSRGLHEEKPVGSVVPKDPSEEEPGVTSIRRASRPALIVAILIGTAVAALGATDVVAAPSNPKPSGPSDVATYARDFGVTLQEAERRFAVIEQARRLQTILRSNHADAFGGSG
jgi:hypothetical protein